MQRGMGMMLHCGQWPLLLGSCGHRPCRLRDLIRVHGFVMGLNFYGSRKLQK